jgi:hypothetical protein
LVELALGAAYREVRNGDRLAPKGILRVLEMEESARRTGKADDRLGGSETNPKDKFGEPALGSTRIHGELLKLGIEVSQATVAKYMARRQKPYSQTWRTFLNNHVKELASTDFFVVPTLSFRVLFVFLVLAHHRRRVLHFNVTAHPTSEWTAQQIAEASPWDSPPRYLLHDRDSIYGEVFRQRVRGMAIREVLTAPRSPWQNAYAQKMALRGGEMA